MTEASIPNNKVQGVVPNGLRVLTTWYRALPHFSFPGRGPTLIGLMLVVGAVLLVVAGAHASPPAGEHEPETKHLQGNAFGKSDMRADCRGAVNEVLVKDDSVGKEAFIDFDTGKLFTPPLDVQELGLSGLMSWVEEVGVDAMGETGVAIRGLVCFDMVAVPLTTSQWEAINSDYFKDEELWSIAKGGTPVFMIAKGEVPATYAFKTCDGGRGVLQILGFTEEPPALQIRFRMVPLPTTQQELLEERVPSSEPGRLRKLGLGPALSTHLREGRALDIDTETVANVSHGRVWPARFEIGWDSTGGGVLVLGPSQSLCILELSDAKDLADAVVKARARRTELRSSRARFARAESGFAAVITSENRLAIVEIRKSNTEFATIRWCLDRSTAE